VFNGGKAWLKTFFFNFFSDVAAGYHRKKNENKNKNVHSECAFNFSKCPALGAKERKVSLSNMPSRYTRIFYASAFTF
jgi:hypothetical protein